MTPGSHGSTFGGNPLAMAAANAVLDVMLKPGFFEHVQKMSLLLKQKLAEVVDRYPERARRGARRGPADRPAAVVPSGDLVDALRDEKLLTVGAGDNVVRLPAAADRHEAEIEEAVAWLERACARCRGAQLKQGGGDEQAAPFPRSDRAADRSCAACSSQRRAMKAKLKAHRKPRQAARRQDAGDDLRQALDPHARVVRRRHAPARRRVDHADRRRRCSSAAARPSPTPRACCRAMSTPS
jgi:hypothetical protein